MTSLDPLYTVGNQIMEALTLHQNLRGEPARQAAIRALEAVGIPDAARRIDAYPHQLSGGMRQRVMIAIALSCNPEILIADEPTTALDVTIQARILDLLKALRTSRKMALILITHNMGLVAEMCDRVLVMHDGQIVESQPVRELFAHPAHPYTRGLLRSIPRLDSPPKQPLPTLDWEPAAE
jgi:peptide/nickel transport system ATP-binding protein